MAGWRDALKKIEKMSDDDIEGRAEGISAASVHDKFKDVVVKTLDHMTDLTGDMKKAVIAMKMCNDAYTMIGEPQSEHTMAPDSCTRVMKIFEELDFAIKVAKRDFLKIWEENEANRGQSEEPKESGPRKSSPRKSPSPNGRTRTVQHTR